MPDKRPLVLHLGCRKLPGREHVRFLARQSQAGRGRQGLPLLCALGAASQPGGKQVLTTAMLID